MKRALIVAVVVGMVGGGLAWAEQAGMPVQATKFPMPAFVLQCQPFGAAEFVNDVQIWNKGTKAVPSGTKVHWEVMNGQWKGDYTFTANLAPGAKVVLNDVMNGAQSQGDCTVKVVLKELKKVIDPEIIKKLAAVLQCQPFDAAEFVNDVQIWNKGTKPVPSGTKVHWEVMNGQWKGNYTFTANLAPGAKVVLNNVMNGAQSQGNCTVKVVEPIHMQIKPENMRLMKLQAPDPRYAMRAAAQIVQPPPQVQWKEIECGIFVWPPPNPSNQNVTSRRLFFVNSTETTLPVGTIVKYEVEGMPASCCTGIRPPWSFALPPNPPTTWYAYSEDVLSVPQPWTRPCKAWANVP